MAFAACLLPLSITALVPVYGIEFAVLFGLFLIAIFIWLPIGVESKAPQTIKSIPKQQLPIYISWIGLGAQMLHALGLSVISTAIVFYK